MMSQIVIDNIGTHFYITEDGRCYNSDTHRFLNGTVHMRGFREYVLRIKDAEGKLKYKKTYAHNLVAEAFLPKPKTDKKLYVIHKDGNKLNNHVDNLCWVSRQTSTAVGGTVTQEQKEQFADATVFQSVYCFNRNREIVAKYKNLLAASLATGVSEKEIMTAASQKELSRVNDFYFSFAPTLENVRFYEKQQKQKAVYQYSLTGKYINKYESVGLAARSIGKPNGASQISECARGKCASALGFVWKYEEDIVSSLNESQS
nr:MAG TPA: homing endonuclease [Caudoviricetes sp.]